MIHDYAKAENSGFWLRHPVLGDPSFDTFQKIGSTVHKSEPPYEWAVNGSLFCDQKDGALYYYAGLYGFGYRKMEKHSAHFIIYKSIDKGHTWECIGPGLSEEIAFDHIAEVSRECPDAVLVYDDITDLYWLAYDWSSEGSTWENAFSPNGGVPYDSGSALAWAKSPAGPFHPLPAPLFSNKAHFGKLGFFLRGYATTLLKRNRDWIAFVLCDSADFFSWGLACMTAPSPEGPWSEPNMLLSVERPEYYPAPVEFFPCFSVDGRVYAPATSVAASRNYQAVYSAELENAHIAGSWSLLYDGNVWHSRYIEDEKYGIWGQTIHGFVRDGMFTVMYPSKDSRNYGTLSLAQRPWDRPIGNGFTISAHSGEAVSPLLFAYRDFVVTARISTHGTVDIAFQYDGLLGPNRSSSDSFPHRKCLACYSAVRITDEEVSLVSVDKDGKALCHFKYTVSANNMTVRLARRDDTVAVYLDDTKIGSAAIPQGVQKPLALIAHQFSMLSCDLFSVEGERFPYVLRYNCHDALLGAGQRLGDWTAVQSGMFICEEGFVGSGNVKAKWNIIGDGVTVYSPKSPDYGVAAVWIDGYFYASVDLYCSQCTQSAPVCIVKDLVYGRHSVLLKPYMGSIAIDCIEVTGNAAEDIAL